jgi:hypothetical protein
VDGASLFVHNCRKAEATSPAENRLTVLFQRKSDPNPEPKLLLGFDKLFPYVANAPKAINQIKVAV